MLKSLREGEQRTIGYYTKKTAAIFAGDALGQTLQLALSVWMARALGPTQLGFLILLMAIAAYAEKFGRFTIDKAAVYLLGKGAFGFSQVQRHLFLISLTLAAVWVALAFLLKETIYINLLKSQNVPPAAFVLAVLHIPLVIQIINGRMLFTQTGMARPYNTSLWLTGAIQLSILAALKLILGSVNVTLALGAGLIGHLATTAYIQRGLKGVDPGQPFRLNFSLIKELFSRGIRYYAITITHFLLLRLDLFLVAYYLDPRQVAFYSLATTAGQLLWRLPQVAGVFFFPLSAGIKSDAEAARFAANTLRHVSYWLVLGAAAGVFLITPATRLLYGPDYLPLVNAFLALLPGIVTMGAAKIFLEYFNARAWTKPPMRAVAAGLILNVVLNLALLPQWGIIGASIASSASYTLTMALMGISFLQKSSLGIMALMPQKEDLKFYAKHLRLKTSTGA
ncbi:MAG: polysaccharide biosynthesis C-terminal domain-containing protein [Elusimicrobia bacterium]|nr:polysaccharide biosynthesis C-terminal domain-containing protein [Elusimicrobiota bacterium]